jgi:hypothetical protein
MTTVYVEARPKGCQEAAYIEDFGRRLCGPRPAHCSDQEDAIAWAKKAGRSRHVARVRHLNDKKKPHHWRAV